MSHALTLTSVLFFIVLSSSGGHHIYDALLQKPPICLRQIHLRTVGENLLPFSYSNKILNQHLQLNCHCRFSYQNQDLNSEDWIIPSRLSQKKPGIKLKAPYLLHVCIICMHYIYIQTRLDGLIKLFCQSILFHRKGMHAPETHKGEKGGAIILDLYSTCVHIWIRQLLRSLLYIIYNFVCYGVLTSIAC